MIFCQINHSAMVHVIEQLKAVPEIKKVFSLTGDYDVLCELEVDSTEDLYEAFSERIDKIKGIIKTNTHIVMKSFEK